MTTWEIIIKLKHGETPTLKELEMLAEYQGYTNIEELQLTGDGNVQLIVNDEAKQVRMTTWGYEVLSVKTLIAQDF